MRKFLLLSTYLAASLQTAQADDLDYSLTVGERKYTIADLEERFEQTEILTVSTWTHDDELTYSGPKLSEILDDAGLLDAVEVTLKTLDEYAVDVPVSFIMTYEPILATRIEGEPITFSDKGPVRVIWPRSDHPEELGSVVDGYWPWYLLTINRTSETG